MLPAPFRMRTSALFDETVRNGVRAGRPSVVVHASRSSTSGDESVRVGFVVSRKVGNAVTRNRVKRRLRHLASALLRDTPAGVSIVVRALPEAATESNRLAEDLASAWRGCVRRLVVAQ